MKLSRSMDHGALRVPPGLLHLNLPALPHRFIVFECRPDSATASLMSMNMGNECDHSARIAYQQPDRYLDRRLNGQIARDYLFAPQRITANHCAPPP